MFQNNTVLTLKTVGSALEESIRWKPPVWQSWAAALLRFQATEGLETSMAYIVYSELVNVDHSIWGRQVSITPRKRALTFSTLADMKRGMFARAVSTLTRHI